MPRTQGGADRNDNGAIRSALGWIVSQPFWLNGYGNNDNKGQAEA